MLDRNNTAIHSKSATNGFSSFEILCIYSINLIGKLKRLLCHNNYTLIFWLISSYFSCKYGSPWTNNGSKFNKDNKGDYSVKRLNSNFSKQRKGNSKN